MRVVTEKTVEILQNIKEVNYYCDTCGKEIMIHDYELNEIERSLRGIFPNDNCIMVIHKNKAHHYCPKCIQSGDVPTFAKKYL